MSLTLVCRCTIGSMVPRTTLRFGCSAWDVRPSLRKSCREWNRQWYRINLRLFRREPTRLWTLYRHLWGMARISSENVAMNIMSWQLTDRSELRRPYAKSLTPSYWNIRKETIHTIRTMTFERFAIVITLRTKIVGYKRKIWSISAAMEILTRKILSLSPHDQSDHSQLMMFSLTISN